MACCTFFGHRTVSDEIKSVLLEIIIDLIEYKNVNLFYVGNKGEFDCIVKDCLKSVQEIYPQIKYYVVLAYMPTEKDKLRNDYFLDTIYPDGLEKTPPKYCINKRNLWMIEKSDYVITYVKHSFSNAVKYKEKAESKGKTVINIAEY